MPESRIAVVVSDLARARAFYGVGLELQLVGEFHEHDGWSSVIFAFPDAAHQLEITTHKDARPQPGGDDDLLVLWLDSDAEVQRIVDSLPAGSRARPANPSWHGRSETVRDPDGHRVTLAWQRHPYDR
jgi:catechol 2,3-dioxygenase-like lactoylglutathione lyase family enzyme